MARQAWRLSRVEARLGLAVQERHGVVCPVLARYGKAGKAWPGQVRHGGARQGRPGVGVWRGRVW